MGPGGGGQGRGGLALKPKFCLSLESVFSRELGWRPAPSEGPFGTAGVTCGAGVGLGCAAGSGGARPWVEADSSGRGAGRAEEPVRRGLSLGTR